jgi:hypothetical protein
VLVLGGASVGFGNGAVWTGVLVLRPSLRLGRDWVGSVVWDLEPRSVDDRAAGLFSAVVVVGNIGVVELRPPLAVLLLGLRTGS